MIVKKGYEKLLRVLDKGIIGKTVTSLLKELGGSPSTLEKRLSLLVSEGFLRDERSDKFPFKRTIFLTKKGRRVLKLIDEGKL